MWTLKVYASKAGASNPRKTLQRLNADVRAAFESAMDHLCALDKNAWQKPKAKRLETCKSFRDFYEVRFFAGRVQHRPIGFFGHDQSFILVLWTEEKGNRFVQRDWCEIAERRRQLIMEDSSNATLLEFTPEED